MATVTPSRAVTLPVESPAAPKVRSGRQGRQCSRNREVGRLTCWQHANLEKLIHVLLVDAGDQMFSKVMFTGKENDMFEVTNSVYVQGSSSDGEDDDDDDDYKDPDNGNLSGDEELSDSIPKVCFVAAAPAQRRHRLTAPLHTPAQVQENINLLICARDAISDMTSSSGTTSGSASAGERQQSRSRRLSPPRDFDTDSPPSSVDALERPRSMLASPAETVVEIMDSFPPIPMC